MWNVVGQKHVSPGACYRSDPPKRLNGRRRRRWCFQVYAMKSMLKDHMILKNQVTHVKAERDVMAEADDPWIVKLMYSFQVRETGVTC